MLVNIIKPHLGRGAIDHLISLESFDAESSPYITAIRDLRRWPVDPSCLADELELIREGYDFNFNPVILRGRIAQDQFQRVFSIRLSLIQLFLELDRKKFRKKAWCSGRRHKCGGFRNRLGLSIRVDCCDSLV
jgi:hypothetical protein